MSIFNEEQIKAMFSREYICHECGHLMEFEDEWGHSIDLDDYGCESDTVMVIPYQNAAIVNCEQLINELQRVVEIFDVDLNVYNRYVKAIDREIGLIKRWRQRDMAIKSRLEKG